MKNKLKKVISTCLAAIMLLSTAVVAPISASAAETQAVSTGYTSGDFEYETDYYDGTVEITDYTGSATELSIPSEIDGKKVTSIGSYAFYNCKSLKSITIPDGVTSIGGYAFENCTSLTSITIPDSVEFIGEYAFSDTVWYDNQPDGLLYYGKVLYEYKGTMPQNTTITIKDGTKSIGWGAFEDCTSLTSITIPDSVTSIGNGAFENCTSLTSVTLPSSVTRINEEAFDRCTSLKSITIPDSVTSIDNFAFYYCTSLTSVTIPDSVTSIGGYAFCDCTSLENITIPDSVTYIGFSAFSNTAWYNNQPDGVVYAGKVLYEYKGEMPQNTTITIKDGTKVIGYSAFYNCTGLASVTIPDSVTYIGILAFSSCTSLTSITIPGSITSIGMDAFFGCTSLKSVTIPASVDFIGDYAFGYYIDDDYIRFKIDGFTITGYNGTAAEQYAKRYGVEFVSLGEVPTTEPTTSEPTTEPTEAPTTEPTEPASTDPTEPPTTEPTNPVVTDPTEAPTTEPTEVPTTEPTTAEPTTVEPTTEPTEAPTTEPTEPTTEPTTAEPTTEPTEVPTTEPTEPATVVTDKDTNVSVEGEIPEGVELKVQSEEIADENAIAVYNITLQKNGEAVQPDGKVTVKLPVPDGVDGSQCKVYYINGDDKTDMNAVFVDGFMVFETDHFSVYAVVKTEKTSVLLGDVNGDGKVNINDATTIQKSAASLITLAENQKKAADVTGDGKVNVNDTTAIQKFVAGIDTGFKIGE